MTGRQAVVHGRAARLAIALGLGLPVALAALAALVALVALVGCAMVAVGQVEPALFPATAAASAPPLAARVALVLPPALREQTHPGPHVPAGGKSNLQLPLGAIVDAALQRQLAAAFTGGARPAALPLPADSGAELALSVSEVRLVFDRHLNWVVPIPVPAVMLFVAPLASSTDYSARLELDVRVTDALGRQRAQATVDSGKVVLERGQWASEGLLQLYLKLTHQAAWHAAAKAADLMRETLQAERQRERPL